MQGEYQLKKQMCEIGDRIWRRGFCAGNEGNHTVRIDDHRVLCTPTGVSKGMLSPEDICVVDMDGNQIEKNARGRKRTSEVLVHLAIYRKRPDVRAVIHSHPPHAVAFCIANMPLPVGIHPEAEVFLGQTLYAPYATPGGPKLPDSFLDQITPTTNTILMANHGTVSFGGSLTDAYYLLEILDNYCKQLILAKQLGRVNVLDAAQMTELLELKQRFGFKDERLACAPQGCVSRPDQPFLTAFDVQPMSASCSCDGGAVTTRGASAGAAAGGEEAFERLVQSITDQIMAAAS
jgi:L-fuculose-phosphate aldolase